MITLAQPDRHILVTGSHRSGTTWLGTVLNAHKEVAYIHEPLNVSDGPAVMRSAVQNCYQYICAENEDRYLPPLRAVLAAGCQAEECRKIHRRHTWTVIKDPFAMFSVPWFATALGCRPVITVRQPAAVVSSLKRLGWHFDHRHLLEQPLLMRDWLAPYRREMEALAGRPDDVIGQGCLLWRMIYGTAAQLPELLPETVIVRHEDLSLAPRSGYHNLLEKLGIRAGKAVGRAIKFFSHAQNPKETSVEPPHTVALDSRANLENWKRRLTPDEIQRIRELTADVAALYYSEAELENFTEAHRDGRPIARCFSAERHLSRAA